RIGARGSVARRVPPLDHRGPTVAHRSALAARRPRRRAAGSAPAAWCLVSHRARLPRGRSRRRARADRAIRSVRIDDVMTAPDPATYTIGYALDAVLARTEHSLVLSADARRTARRVAIKVAVDHEGADALRRELQVLRGLRHAHVLEVIEGTA